MGQTLQKIDKEQLAKAVCSMSFCGTRAKVQATQKTLKDGYLIPFYC